MPNIRPISDLRNHFAEITKEAQASKEPIFLTKNGSAAIVVMGIDAYEEYRYESEVYDKLHEAEIEAASSDKRFTHEEVITALRRQIQEAEKRA